ncbi:DUF6338 family protein [Pseudonocardia acaciae]|uniref:DUF6338 family protein n=1 Tax=Pseudonocardia acaciae TaxID=551276 RepID=UPI00049034F2|nr:DUF6338 family protein [Pseudonocardia acaciae]
MSYAPSTAVQAVFLVLLVLPGLTYQFVRERWRGQTPAEGDLGQRVLRAVVASIVLDALYAIAAGPQLLSLARGPAGRGWDGLSESPRTIGLVALVLFVVVPAVAAGLVSWLSRRRATTRYVRTPTAWDFAFENRGSCFVRGRLTDGAWIGGWYGERSYASTYPRGGELYLESARRMHPNGRFGERVEHSAGLYIRTDALDFVEFLTPRAPQAAPEKETE